MSRFVNEIAAALAEVRNFVLGLPDWWVLAAIVAVNAGALIALCECVARGAGR